MLEQIKLTLQVAPLNCTQGFTDQLHITPIFKNVPIYHAIWHVLNANINRLSLACPTHAASGEWNKQTWRMYEQWVFLQIAAAR